MKKRFPLTDVDIAKAYAFREIDGVGSLHFDPEPSPKAVRRAIIQAVCRGHVEHSGDPERGWLTEEGIALLNEKTQAEYRTAVRSKTMMRAG